MNKIELNSLRKGVLFLFVIVIGYMIVRAFIPADYKVLADESLKSEVTDRFVTPEELLTRIPDEMEGVILVDLRDKEMFDFESVDGSINIPFENLLDRKHLKKIRKEEIWLISSSEIRSHDAAFLLNQLGYDARAVNTNIENILGLKDNPVPAKGYGSDEKEKFNYRNFIKQVDQPNTDVIQETDEVVIRQGGC